MLRKIHQSKNITYDYLILGSNGLLGSEIKKVLSKRKVFSIAKTSSSLNMDLCNFKKLDNFFNQYKFKYVINCAAITNLKACELNKKKAWKINTLLPKKLSELSKKNFFKYIHISTDHFFSSKKISYKKETAKTKIINYYSKTKLEAEKYVKKNKKNLIIRTNFTGFKKKNIQSTFIGWILFNIIKKNKIKLFVNMYTSTLDVNTLSKILIKLIKLDANGIYNVAARGCLNKKEFALKFARNLKKKLNYEELVLKKSSKLNRGLCMCLNVAKVEKKLDKKMISINRSIYNLSKIVKK